MSSTGVVDRFHHELRGDVDAVVGQHVVGLEHLHGGDSDALAEGDRTHGRSAVLVGRQQDPGGLVRELERRLRAEAEPTEVAVETVPAQHLGQLDGADVGRLRQDPRDGVVLGGVRVVVGEEVVAHLQRVGHGDLGVGSDEAFLEGGRHRDDLVH